MCQRFFKDEREKFDKNLCNRTIVGFGDWSNNDKGGFIKKTRSGPV